MLFYVLPRGGAAFGKREAVPVKKLVCSRFLWYGNDYREVTQWIRMKEKPKQLSQRYKRFTVRFLFRRKEKITDDVKRV